MKQLNRVDTTKLYPVFLKQIEQLITNLEKRGYVFFVISAFRSAQEQSKLYAQGRSLPGKIVTNANAFESFHNYGLAVDFCLDIDHNKENGLQPNWDITAYEVLAEEARKLGLVSGMDFKSFKEGPHVQFKTEKTTKQLKELFEKGGLQNVFNNI